MNGQAKIDFEKWLDSDKNNLCGLDLFQLNNTCINALKIEWFDIVGAYIDISVAPNLDYKFTYSINSDRLGYNWFNTRQQATEKAIEKATELYNLKFKQNE